MDDQLNADTCCKYLKALADPERFRIVQCLRDGSKTVGEISRQLDSPIANVSHHLKQLRVAGLVRGHRKGRNVSYAIAAEFAGPAKRARLKVLDFGCCRIELGKK
ncbi:MAG TPA: metalloregulator ArsR/SmtB family transcription factor [Tepidisphaeraceae bacterium]|jgi:DNA-binding transcriptional ArsR family regulator|nr:metalloregulator ArsR/SmtB family transcription factor [Tepidisphaeraceae bacterium]